MDNTLIIGLGNPDPTLEETYHNAGMLAVRWLANDLVRAGISTKFKNHKGVFSYAKTSGMILVLPLVYMNESGIAARDAMKAFDIPPERIVVIHDDSDIPVGEIKFSSGGGSAGHKGIRSIIDHIKTNDFRRIRIGIREKEEVHRKKAEEFVLSPITKKDRGLLESTFETIAQKLKSEAGL